jgi:ABC-type molybdate transport system substrate-binding protein
MGRRTSIVIALLWACLTVCCLPGTAVATQVRAAAASDLKFALDDVVAAFRRHTGPTVPRDN